MKQNLRNCLSGGVLRALSLLTLLLTLGLNSYADKTAETLAPATRVLEDSNAKFVMVTDDSQLVDGGEYIIINKPFKSGKVSYGTYVMGAPKSTNGFNAISIDANATDAPETVELKSDVEYTTVTLKIDAEENYLMVGEKYLAGDKSKLGLKDDKTSVKISLNDDSTVTVVTGKDGNKDATLQMYAQNASGKPANEVFNAYSSAQQPVYFYAIVPAVPTAPEAPTLSADVEMKDGIIVGDQLVFNDVEEGVSIWYMLEYRTENVAMREVNADGYTKYEGPVTLTTAMKGVSFYAEKDGVKSAVQHYDVDVESGIAGIEAEAGEAVYYNLQGVRVENPAKGLFIRVANGKSQKVIL